MFNQRSSDFIQYLATQAVTAPEALRLPSLSNLAKELGISVAQLREQVEVAKAMGFIEARPRTGLRRLPYSFLPAVRQSLNYAITVDPHNFIIFSDLRNHIEAAYWEPAVSQLTLEDQAGLKLLLGQAWEKLNGTPIQIPHAEHRQLHLGIFSRLDNPFVNGILEAYWEAYEAVGLSMYTDYTYLRQVWTYHQEMVDAICRGDLQSGYQALVEHKDLLRHRPASAQAEPVNGRPGELPKQK